MVSKRDVRRAFNKAALHYDAAIDIQKIVGATLLRYVPNQSEVERILDLGSGSGYLTQQLLTAFPGASIFAIDFAENMLKNIFYHKNTVVPICADADFLCFADNSFYIITANFVLQWCVDLSVTFVELYRVLKNGGRLLFSLPAYNTFQELRCAWEKVDQYVHVNHFLSTDKLIEILKKVGFIDIQIIREKHQVYYKNALECVKKLKKMGCNNYNHKRCVSLTGKNSFQNFLVNLDRYRTTENLLPITYEVLYVTCRKFV